MQVGSVLSANALPMVCAIALCGCAIGSGAKNDSPGKATARVEAPPQSSTLDQLDPTMPKLVAPLGGLPPSARLDAIAQERDPRSLEATLGLARIDQLAGRFEEAERSFRNAARENPDNPLAQGALGFFYAARKRWPKAAEQLEVVLDLTPDDAVIRNQYAVALAHTGRPSAALREFTRTVGQAAAHYNLGFIHWQKGDQTSAKREFRRALAIRADLDQAKIMLARMGAKPPDHSVVVPAGSIDGAESARKAIWIKPAASAPQDDPPARNAGSDG